eukprot:TRINITY_DN3250_c1_g1_i1.p5 TRINITY_DN3250_c1_g1~~TRINITY_DN3250_c1_g1_i1.p5  ORF type:complete len:102 (-),score=4.73 TRINITY_DN3250_c1_g1_i1:564-869(-)
MNLEEIYQILTTPSFTQDAQNHVCQIPGRIHMLATYLFCRVSFFALQRKIWGVIWAFKWGGLFPIFLPQASDIECSCCDEQTKTSCFLHIKIICLIGQFFD